MGSSSKTYTTITGSFAMCRCHTITIAQSKSLIVVALSYYSTGKTVVSRLRLEEQTFRPVHAFGAF